MSDDVLRVLVGDCREGLRSLPDDSVRCCVTSPPYWGLRDYGVRGQIGLEPTAEDCVAQLVAVFREVRRVLTPDGTLWLNLGDCYAGAPGGGQGKHGQRRSRTFTARIDVPKRGGDLKPKDLVGFPWMVAFALRADGWHLRAEVIWHKPNPIPESVADRPSRAHEVIFLLARGQRYYYDADAIRTPLAAKTRTAFGTTRRSKGTDAVGKVASHNLSQTLPVRRPRLREDGSEAGANKRDVWTVASRPYRGAHFATFPPALIEPCVKAGSAPGDVVLDPFGGSGTTAGVALALGRRAVLCELNPDYAALVPDRVADIAKRFAARDRRAARHAPPDPRQVEMFPRKESA